jgi:exopolyphosphatase/guanosine-5'-triphosphate,3'-diphosphate pyrophosphatase
MRLLRRHIQNVVDDIRREMPLREASHVIALGGDIRFVAAHLRGREAAAAGVPALERDQLQAFCESIVADDVEQLADRFHLALTEAETLTPALLALRELLLETPATHVVIPEASLRLGLLLDLAGAEEGPGFEEFGRQVRASAESLGEKYRYDAAHGRHVAFLATRLFDELRPEHGLAPRDRLLLEVAALLHDVGIFIDLRGHHKHSQYILLASQIFGLSRDDMAVISNVARYHRRALPARSHPFYISLEREMRLVVDKTAAILRAANALDADHLQKVKDFKLVRETDSWVLQVEAAGDLTMERLAFAARSDHFAEVFGRRLTFREAPAP